MKKVAKKSSNAFLYIFIGVVIIVGLIPVVGVLHFIGSNYLYEGYMPKSCQEKLIQTNTIQPPIQVGTNWTDGGTLYFLPQQVYIGIGGYGYFAKEHDKTTCQQYITVKGVLEYRQKEIATVLPSSELTIELTLQERIDAKNPYQLTAMLQSTLSPYAPTLDPINHARIMQFDSTLSAQPGNEPTEIMKHGFGFVSELNGSSNASGSLLITQQDGIWNVQKGTL